MLTIARAGKTAERSAGWGIGCQVRRLSNGVINVDNPFSGELFCSVEKMDQESVTSMVLRAKGAQEEWKRTSLQTRISVCNKATQYFDSHAEEIARDISGQMGKPLSQALGEIRGFKERAVALVDLAPQALDETVLGPTTNNADTKRFHRAMVREPVGVALTLAPWNYPLLTAINSVYPALLAGNALILSHGFRTPLISGHFARAFKAAGAPSDLVGSLQCDYDVLHQAIRAGQFDFVSYTGSVAGGRAVNESVGKSKKFFSCNLELGGNDGAFVAHDADMGAAVETIVDGGLYNAGQSCCGIERVFVHESLYDEFLDRAVEEVHRAYACIGDPMDPETNIGPLAQPDAPSRLEGLIKDATSKGARIIQGGVSTSRLFAPTLIANCDETMEIMVEESFGPILAIQKVSTQKEAENGINASKYGLTSSIFTNSESNAQAFAENVNVGTVFMNRADYLDPYLAWQGRKDTGKGLSLSKYGFDAFTHIKNHHFKRI
mmetsp:Transcript_1157/g.2310  ORF Transcript_1157/g.2310 Transcript_1157/m.2310 type:complete len:493 (+) Transcript_1157:58-1536(+)